jgi:Glycosyltransferase family 92
MISMTTFLLLLQAMNLIEFFELYAELGVTHFHLYNYNKDPTIDCIIQSYVAKGLVSYHSWDLEIIEEGGIWVHGIHAALNDCLYRSMYRYSNVAVVDLDEFIIPKQADSLVKLIE